MLESMPRRMGRKANSEDPTLSEIFTAPFSRISCTAPLTLGLHPDPLSGRVSYNTETGGVMTRQFTFDQGGCIDPRVAMSGAMFLSFPLIGPLLHGFAIKRYRSWPCSAQ